MYHFGVHKCYAVIDLLLATVYGIIILKGYFELSVYVFNRKVKFVFYGN